MKKRVNNVLVTEKQKDREGNRHSEREREMKTVPAREGEREDTIKTRQNKELRSGEGQE